MNAFVRFIYAALLAAVVVAFANISIYTFYPAPKAPDYPTYSSSKSETETRKDDNAYQKAYENYRENEEKPYRQTVSLVLVIIGTVAVAVGYYLLRKNQEVLGEGLSLGGMATYVSAVITASMADNRVLRFAAVTLLLGSVVLLIQKRFVAAEKVVVKK